MNPEACLSISFHDAAALDRDADDDVWDLRTVYLADGAPIPPVGSVVEFFDKGGFEQFKVRILGYSVEYTAGWRDREHWYPDGQRWIAWCERLPRTRDWGWPWTHRPLWRHWLRRIHAKAEQRRWERQERRKSRA